MNAGRTNRSRLPQPIRKALVRLRSLLVDTHVVRSYSQEGEDLILARIFEGVEQGFYVDVGAHHPKRFSNTYGFYRRGWRGINIEPNPDAVRLFRSARQRDINLQTGVAEQPASLVYHQFDESALNTFDGELANWRVANTPYKLVGKSRIPVERLDAILARVLPAGQRIEFLSIDVEGLDFAVLRSNDWQRFRPECVLVEALATSLVEAMSGELVLFMRAQGYEVFAKTYNTLIFRQSAGTGT